MSESRVAIRHPPAIKRRRNKFFMGKERWLLWISIFFHSSVAILVFSCFWEENTTVYHTMPNLYHRLVKILKENYKTIKKVYRKIILHSSWIWHVHFYTALDCCKIIGLLLYPSLSVDDLGSECAPCVIWKALSSLLCRRLVFSLLVYI